MVPSEVVLFGAVPGGMEMVIILMIAVLLFGADKIPKLARSTGEAMGEFQKGRKKAEEELEELKEGQTKDENQGDVVSETSSSSSSSSSRSSGSSGS